MESLALMVFILFCAVLLCGPAAVLLAYYRRHVLALLFGGAALMLGFYWFGTVVTAAKWLGAGAALLGLWALLKATGDIFS